MLGHTGKSEEILKLDRLKKRSDFLCVQNEGQKWVAKSMIVFVYPNIDQGLRFGVTATKKLSKRAVDRNRAKRRLRAAAQDVLPLIAKDNMDIVLIARGDTFSKPYIDVVNDLKWCLKRLECQRTKG